MGDDGLSIEHFMISRFVESQRKTTTKRKCSSFMFGLADRYVCPYLRTSTNARKVIIKSSSL